MDNTQTNRSDHGYVTFEKMVGYVEGRLEPITEHAAEHDRWHLLQIQNEDQARRQRTIAVISQLIAALAVIVAMVTVILSHVGK